MVNSGGKEGNKTFLRITNRDIYEKLIKIEEDINKISNEVTVNRRLIKWLWIVISGTVITLIGKIVGGI